MARPLRMILPNLPHHIVQRGHNRDPVFHFEDDYQTYCSQMRRFRDRIGVSLYAYCLMPNHVHLIINPGEDVATLSDFMKRLAGQYSRHINHREGRRGTLWDGRFRSNPIQSDRYLQNCCRYVEMNPVRAGLVSDPMQYRWSSVRERAGQTSEQWLDEDPCYLDLGRSRIERERHYRIWFDPVKLEPDLDKIRRTIREGGIIADESYRLELESQTGKVLKIRGRGRPSRASHTR